MENEMINEITNCAKWMCKVCPCVCMRSTHCSTVCLDRITARVTENSKTIQKRKIYAKFSYWHQRCKHITSELQPGPSWTAEAHTALVQNESNETIHGIWVGLSEMPNVACLLQVVQCFHGILLVNYFSHVLPIHSISPWRPTNANLPDKIV